MSFVTVSLKPASANGTVRREIERLLQDVAPVRARSAWEPAGDAYEDAKGFTLELDVPGFTPDQLEVLADDGTLLVRGKRPAREVNNESRLLFVERPAGTFERRLRLPKTADVGNVKASYAHGVLTVRVEKVATVAPRRVTINVSEPVATLGVNASATSNRDASSK